MLHARCAVTVLLALCAGGCVIPQRDAAREVLDPDTGATVTAMGTALEFYSPRPDLGLQAASFAQLGAMETNRMGERRLLLWLSVLPGGAAAQQDQAEIPKSLTIVSGTAEHRPALVASAARDIGLSRTPFKRPGDWAHDAYFDVDLDQLREFVTADPLALVITSADGSVQRYELWKPERGSLAQFIEKIAPE